MSLRRFMPSDDEAGDNFMDPFNMGFGRNSDFRVGKRQPSRFVDEHDKLMRKFDRGFGGNDLFRDFFDDDNDFFGGGFKSKIDVHEEPDRYVIYYNDRDINNKEFSCNYDKRTKLLKITTTMKQGGSKEGQGGTSQASFMSSSDETVTLAKEVDDQALKADMRDDVLILTLPKIEVDEQGYGKEKARIETVSSSEAGLESE